MSHYQIDAIRLSPGGTRHEHITDVFGPGFVQKTRFQAVSEIFSRANSFYTKANALAGETPVLRVAANEQVLSQNDYLRTKANGVWTDNLLSLPRK